MCAARVRPERPERLVRQDAACASGRTFFFPMSLNKLLDFLRQALDNPNRTCTANHEIQKLKQKNGTFAAYFADFGRIMGDLNWNEEAQREQLYKGLSDEIKDVLATSSPHTNSLGHLIQICRELDDRICSRVAEWVQPSRNE